MVRKNQHWLSRGAWQGIGALAAVIGLAIAVGAWLYPRSGGTAEDPKVNPPADATPVSPPPFHSSLKPDCARATVDLDVDRYDRPGTTVEVGEHADAYGMNQWAGDPGTLWVFIFQDGVGYFPTGEPSLEQGRWVSYRLGFGRSKAQYPADANRVERSVVLVLASPAAVGAITKHITDSNDGPMQKLPAGTTRLRTVKTVRIC